MRHRDGSRALAQWGEAVGTGQVQPAQEMALGGNYQQPASTHREVIKVMEPGCSMAHRGRTRDNRDKQDSFRYKEKPFHQEDSQAVE